jgi:hypothetical protein
MAYYDLGTYSRKVSTSSDDAQRWFDRGLVWTYSYKRWRIGASPTQPARITILNGG